MADRTDLATLKLGAFEPHLGETFDLALTDSTLPLRLVEATALGQGAREGGGFSLIFTGPHGDCLPQAIYPLDHPALGRLDIFMVPLGPDERGHCYQAVFA